LSGRGREDLVDRFSDDSEDYPYQVEWEYNDNIVVISYYNLTEAESDTAAREVLIGDFEFSASGDFSYASIAKKFLVIYDYSDNEEWGYVHSFADPYVISDTNDVDQLIEFEEFMDDSSRHDQYIIHEFDEADPGDDVGDGKTAFSEANGSGFFQEGWYLNLFGNNFISPDSDYDYKFTGNSGDNVLKGYQGDNFGADFLDGGDGDDFLHGYRGADSLNGGSGNDEVRAGNGRDIITGGAGADEMYGGFGLNTFEDSADGEIDKLLFKSDQWAWNWLDGKAGNSPNGEKADKIVELDEFDEIYIQGVSTSQLSYGFVDHDSRLGETLSGIGIYASGALEAVYVGDDLSMGQISAMTQGVLL